MPNYLLVATAMPKYLVQSPLCNFSSLIKVACFTRKIHHHKKFKTSPVYMFTMLIYLERKSYKI
jgi:hypothetical protein